MDEAVRVGYMVVDAAFGALKARVEADLDGECRGRMLKVIEEIREQARSTAGVMVYLEPDRPRLARLVLLAAVGAAGFLAGFILG